jgi:hypothetical protein
MANAFTMIDGQTCGTKLISDPIQTIRSKIQGTIPVDRNKFTRFPDQGSGESIGMMKKIESRPAFGA